MNSGWAAALTAFAALIGTLAGVLIRSGRRDGKIDAVLEQLTRITQDHETRLRVVERYQPQHRRSR